LSHGGIIETRAGKSSKRTRHAAGPGPSAQWPADPDALAAAPAHHTLLFENERVRVLDMPIAAGDRTPIHTHRRPGVLYILSWTTCVRYDAQGEVLLDSGTVPALQAPPPAG
jgi:quercetin dioxygenase-like cupin family protein